MIKSPLLVPIGTEKQALTREKEHICEGDDECHQSLVYCTLIGYYCFKHQLTDSELQSLIPRKTVHTSLSHGRVTSK